MCLGIPGQVVEMIDGLRRQLALVDVQGAQAARSTSACSTSRRSRRRLGADPHGLRAGADRRGDGRRGDGGPGADGPSREEASRSRSVAVPERDPCSAHPSPARCCSRATRSRPTPTATAGPPTTTPSSSTASSGADDRGLRAMSQQFAGAWPYLELIAAPPASTTRSTAGWSRPTGWAARASTGSRRRGRRLDGGPIPRHDRVARSRPWPRACIAGGVPHHSFAVFCIYPWTGLLSDGRKAEHALTVLDRCRIRWGKVMAVQGDQVVVESRAADLGRPHARLRRTAAPRPPCARSTASA